MYADFNIYTSFDYLQAVICKCGRTIHLKETETSEYDNLITCPVCGYQMHLIRPRANDIKIDV